MDWYDLVQAAHVNRPLLRSAPSGHALAMGKSAIDMHALTHVVQAMANSHLNLCPYRTRVYIMLSVVVSWPSFSLTFLLTPLLFYCFGFRGY